MSVDPISLGLMAVSIGAGMIQRSMQASARKKQQGNSRQAPEDLNVSASTYGMGIPEIFGTYRIKGEIIWSEPRKKVKPPRNGGKKSGRKKSKKGKGGAAAESEQEVYLGTFATSFCRGPAKIIKIWAGQKLIYDISNPATVEGSVRIPGKAFKHHSGSYRIYSGEVDQPVDSVYEAFKGNGECTAFRDLCYVRFKDLPLTDYGNSVPVLEAEVTRNFEESYATTIPNWSNENTWVKNQGWGGISNGPFNLSGDLGGVTLDLTPGKYQAFVVAPYGSSFYNFNTITGNIIAAKTINLDATDDSRYTSYFGPPILDLEQNVVWVGVNGYSSTSGFYRALVAHDADTLEVKKTYKGATYLQGPRMPFGSQGIVDAFVYDGLLLGVVGKYSYPQYTYVPGELQFTLTPGSGSIEWNELLDYGRPIKAVVDPFNRRAWVISRMEDSFGDIRHTSIRSYYGKWGNASEGVVENYVADWGYYCRATDRIILMSVTGRIVALNGNDLSVAYDNVIPDAYSDYSGTGGLRGLNILRNQPVLSGAFYWLANEKLLRIDTTSGQVMESWVKNDIKATNGEVDINIEWETCFIEPETKSIWFKDGFYAYKVQLGTLKAMPISIGTVSALITENTGLAESQVNVTDISTGDLEIQGYASTKPQTARNLLDPFLIAFGIVPKERDGVLYLEKQKMNPVGQITQENMIAVEDNMDGTGKGPKVIEKIRDTMQIPFVCEVSYSDANKDYQPASQSARRVTTPFDRPTGMLNRPRQDDAMRIELPIAMSSERAMSIATSTLRRDSSNSSVIEFTCGLEYMGLEIGDVVDVIVGPRSEGLNISKTYRIRVKSIEIGANWEINVIGDTFSGAFVTSGYAGAEMGFSPPQTIPFSVGSKIFLLNLPCLGESNQDGGAWISASPAMPVNDAFEWNGAIVMRSTDGNQEWVAYDSVIYDAAFGIVVQPPLKDVPYTVWDTTSELIVKITDNDFVLSSSTDLGVLNGDNCLIIGNEIIQYVDVEDLGYGQWKLTRLLRGRKGTEGFMEHFQGDTVLHMDDNFKFSGQRFSSLDERGALRYYRGITANGGITVGDRTHEFTNESAALKPYSVANLKVSRNEDNTVLSADWIRRTRFGGEWQNFIGTVPVNEAEEKYEVEIIDVSTNAVMGMKTVYASSVNFTVSNFQTYYDNPGLSEIPTGFILRVFQISGTVGRGYPREKILS